MPRKLLRISFAFRRESFSADGWIYRVESEYYSGTGIDAYLVDSQCRVLEKLNVYSE